MSSLPLFVLQQNVDLEHEMPKDDHGRSKIRTVVYVAIRSLK